MNEIKVAGKQKFMGLDIPVVLGGFGEGKKCISDKTIAEIHGMREPDVRRRITDNIKRFKENVDVIDLAQRACDISTLDNEGVHVTHTLEILLSLGYTKSAITQAEHIYILSERGYAKLIKIMDTDLAWEVHDKLMDEYFELREQRRKLSATEQLRLQQQAILEVDEKIDAVNEDLQEFKRDMPLLALEYQKITWAKNQKVVPLLGGKDAPAYNDNGLRSRVYRDIEGQLRREFDVKTYKAIKRSQCDLAIQIIKDYKLPMVLEEEIRDVNAQMELFEE